MQRTVVDGRATEVDRGQPEARQCPYHVASSPDRLTERAGSVSPAFLRSWPVDCSYSPEGRRVPVIGIAREGTQDEPHATHTVDQGVMHLQIDGEAVSLQAFD